MFYCFARLSCVQVETNKNVYTVTRFSLMVFYYKTLHMPLKLIIIKNNFGSIHMLRKFKFVDLKCYTSSFLLNFFIVRFTSLFRFFFPVVSSTTQEPCR